jgi:hypothetical protein
MSSWCSWVPVAHCWVRGWGLSPSCWTGIGPGRLVADWQCDELVLEWDVCRCGLFRVQLGL